MSVVQIATIEPISLVEAKQWLNVDFDDQDEVIQSIIKAARTKIENRCGISITTKRYRQVYPAFGATIVLSHPPVVSVEGVTYIDQAGDEQAVDAAAYTFIADRLSPYIYPLAAWPTAVATRPDAVRVEYTTGIDIEDSPPEEVPADLLQAMRLLIGSMFENRENELLVPTRQELMVLGDGVEALIAPYFVPRL